MIYKILYYANEDISLLSKFSFFQKTETVTAKSMLQTLPLQRNDIHCI